MKRLFVYSPVFFFILFYTIALSSGVACAKDTGQDGAEQQNINKTVNLPEHAAKGEGKKRGHEGKAYDVPLGLDHPKTVTLPEHAAKGKGKKKGHEGKTYDEPFAYLYSDDSKTENLASAGASAAMAALLDGAGVPFSDLIADNVTGIIMSLIFKGGPDPEVKILNDLGKIEKTLVDIETELANIVDILTALEKQLGIDTAKIEYDILQTTLNDYVSNIHKLWIDYLSLYDKKTDSWVTDKITLDNQASAILVSSGIDILNQLVHIHDGLTGQGYYGNSVFHGMANYLALKVNAGGEGSDPLLNYHLLESYFGTMLLAQTRAATLMVEALRYNEVSNSEFGDYPGTATQFMELYKHLINDQVEHFLNAVEYFVTKTADPTKSLADFVPGADTIFMRADLTAAWLSTLHRPQPDSDLNGQKMIVYRVIGSPLRVEQYGNGFYCPSSTMSFSTMLYEDANQPYYDIPTYETTSHHSWSELNTSPYVQFHPGVLHGTLSQTGLISDASEIWVGKYYTENLIDAQGNFRDFVKFYLPDFDGHCYGHMEVKALNSNGEKVTALWATGTDGNPGAYYVMQDDGNFVIYSKDDVALWATGTHGNRGAYYKMEDNGNFVIYSKDDVQLWATGTDGNPGAIFVMQADGNFVIYDNKNYSYIYYAYVLDIQHPPALLRGRWQTNHFHNHRSDDLSSLTLTMNGDPTDTSVATWVNPTNYLGVRAYPTVTCSECTQGCTVSGSFLQEFANTGWYQWAGSGSPTLEAQFTVYIERNMWVISYPGDKWWGTHIRVENGTTGDNEVFFHTSPASTGTGTFGATLDVNMSPDAGFYLLVGSRASVNWNDEWIRYEFQWNHWNSGYRVTLTDLQLILK